MQEGLKSMWKKKEVPDYRRETRVVDDAGVDIKTGKYVGDSGIDFKACGCLPDRGCKE